MSVFRIVEMPCPACQASVTFNLVHSINADRRPDFRDTILSGTFQEEKCPDCGTEFRVEPEFTYMNLKQKLWIAAWPRTALAEWKKYEAEGRESFAVSLGDKAPESVRDMGQGITTRVTFGWPALVEKIRINLAGLDDRTIELAKASLIRMPGNPQIATSELRLLQVEGDKLTFGWFGGDETLNELVEVDRALLGEIEAAADDWKEIRSQLGDDALFVDLQRILVDAKQPAAAGA
jgi:endogenous inhibitor of DNA gyrase (YacG/DUF329 family)